MTQPTLVKRNALSQMGLRHYMTPMSQGFVVRTVKSVDQRQQWSEIGHKILQFSQPTTTNLENFLEQNWTSRVGLCEPGSLCETQHHKTDPQSRLQTVHRIWQIRLHSKDWVFWTWFKSRTRQKSKEISHCKEFQAVGKAM